MHTKFIRACRILLSSALLVGALFQAEAHAINIDDFSGSSIIGVDSVTPSAVVQTANPGTIGGNRFIKALYISGAGGESVRTTGAGIYSHSQDAATTGQSFIVWDGTNDPAKNPVVPNVTPGFGETDLAEDGASAIVLKDFTADLAGSFTIIIFESSSRAWEVTKNFVRTDPNNDNILDPMDFAVPFADFLPRTGYDAVPVDVSKIHAITLFITGTQNSALDVTLSAVVTNGVCVHTPVNGLVVDECGVCNGDNSTCKDCLGVPNGPALPGTLCDTGDVGICQPGDFDLGCSCVPREPPTAELCDGKDNDCDGQVDEITDQCGVCGGDNSTCSDCLGTPNGTAAVDQCGVCGGDNSSCLDCLGTPKGTATVDQCGVCGGDGTSCTKCDEEDITRIQGALDGTAKKQEKVIKKGIRLLTQLKLKQSTLRTLGAFAKDAHALQVRNWIISWQLPSRILTCPLAKLCVDFSNQPILDEYRGHAEELLKINGEVVKSLQKNKQTGRARMIERAGLSLYNQALNLAATVPVKTQVCTLLPAT